MSGMTLSAQEWFAEFEEIIVNGTMRVMTVGAFFGDVAVFEKERSGLFGMATAAGFFFGHFV